MASEQSRRGQLTLEVSQVALLVELSALETERVDNVIDLLLGVLETLFSLLGGSVGASVDLDSTLHDHGAVSLVDDVVDELEVVRVGDDLVIGEYVLIRERQTLANLRFRLFFLVHAEAALREGLHRKRGGGRGLRDGQHRKSAQCAQEMGPMVITAGGDYRLTLKMSMVAVGSSERGGSGRVLRKRTKRLG